MIALVPAVAVLLAAGAQQTPLPSTATPASTAVPAAPTNAETPPPGAVPTASALPPPATAAPAYGYRFVPRQPAHPVPGEPQIFAVYLNTDTLHSQGPILIKVMTDPATVKVVTHGNGRDNVIPMIAPGDFEAVGKLPKVPFIASGMSILLDFVAVGPTGERTSVKVPVKLK